MIVSGSAATRGTEPRPVPGRGRQLRAASSVAQGYGRWCRTKIRAVQLAEILKGFAAAQVKKARELIADGGLVPTTRPGVFCAVSSDGERTYLAHSAACGCSGPARQGEGMRAFAGRPDRSGQREGGLVVLR